MVPVTFLYDWEFPSDHDRQTVMYEFAANGAKHLVLSDTLLKMICRAPKLYRELRAEVAQAGLDFVDAHAPFAHDVDPCCPDPAVRPFMLANLKLVLQIVHDFGVKSCCVHICSTYYNDYTPQQHRDAVCRTLDKVLPLAEKLDVTIALENIPRLCNFVDDVLFYMKKYPSRHLGACFDSGHANIIEKVNDFPEGPYAVYYRDLGIESPWEPDVLGRMLPHIVNCHLHDNSGERDQHLLPGRGTVDWGKLVPKLLSAPRLMCVQSEVIPLHVRQPIRPLCDKFRELFGEI
jgi:sugar phosphate isomerase/epimerase